MSKYIYCILYMRNIYRIGATNLNIEELLKTFKKENSEDLYFVYYFKEIDNETCGYNADRIIKCVNIIFEKYRIVEDNNFFMISSVDKIIKLFNNFEGKYDVEFKILDMKPIEYFKDNLDDLEFYIRYKLGQRVFPENKKYSGYDHLKFEFDARDNKDDNENNNEILNLFNKFYIKNKLIIKSHKGTIYGLITDINDVDINNVDINNVDINDIGSNENGFQFNGEGTVDILKKLLIKL
jgi:hypothetical protein